MRAALTIITLLVAVGLGVPAAPSGAESAVGLSRYADSFEAASGWQVFEEIVGGSPCYAAGVGIVQRVGSPTFAGAAALSVWANGLRQGTSNHLIAYTEFVPASASESWRYTTHVFVPTASVGQGQVGPELSIQNTRAAEVGFTTATAAVQYIASPYLPDSGGWHVWAATSPGKAGWQDLILAPLAAGQWYTLTLDVDYATNHYLAFGVEGPGTALRRSLAGLSIAEETKGFTTSSFVLTLESENLWNNCNPAAIFDYQVVYDEVEAVTLRRMRLPMVHAP
jgi:hypothetical protein